MSSSSWEEIKRLAADFQRVQLVESSSKYKSHFEKLNILNKSKRSLKVLFKPELNTHKSFIN